MTLYSVEANLRVGQLLRSFIISTHALSRLLCLMESAEALP